MRATYMKTNNMTFSVDMKHLHKVKDVQLHLQIPMEFYMLHVLIKHKCHCSKNLHSTIFHQLLLH